MALVKDIIEGVAHGDVADAVDAFSIQRRDDTALEVDLGEPNRVYVITVTERERDQSTSAGES